jgi:hypothetical protein
MFTINNNIAIINIEEVRKHILCKFDYLTKQDNDRDFISDSIDELFTGVFERNILESLGLDSDAHIFEVVKNIDDFRDCITDCIDHILASKDDFIFRQEQEK